MDITRVDDLRLALRLAGIRPQKSLGQNFLVDRPSLEAMIEAAELSPEETVLEVGPGLGVMTMPLSRQVKQLVAVESDPALAALLRRGAPANLTVVEGDIRRFDLTGLPPGYKVVANIPYYLTSMLIRLLLESANPPDLAVVLVQREVAERLTATAGHYSLIGLAAQYFAKVEVVATVERHKFWPAPAVDSAAVRLRRRDGPLFPADHAQLFRLMKAGFGERRKQLKNSLAGGLNLSGELVWRLLDEADLAASARAQELTLEQWATLYRSAERAGVFA